VVELLSQLQWAQLHLVRVWDRVRVRCWGRVRFRVRNRVRVRVWVRARARPRFKVRARLHRRGHGHARAAHLLLTTYHLLLLITT